ncbi:M16 family metallopeptidase [Alterisphingorhabdus coralli]|uniref:Insulinase family protein n=1 Tax=Alterisphingorhabdus coralli TaxID=3071408 RepID=A0AA97I0A9_9SPHN|nr:insulinase family protein [Parasphingorhabdus sp. SCSIO 66989]WOE74223.1 insulinase family protein [Parasphingorhabdus sp. SCSIO 66989]
MRVRQYLLALCLILLPLAAQAEPAQQNAAQYEEAVRSAWGFDKSDLEPDPAVRFGVLENGMRYAIRHNEYPEDTASIQLVFDVGSLAETDDERGAAHFVEHMAFNGSTNVPEGEMVKILERFGLAFGADTNAYTSFDRTAYTLELPNTSEELIDTALFLLRETASEISFTPGAVDRERGVVLAEMRTRDSYGLRSFIDEAAFLLPDTKIARRLPTGTQKVVGGITAEELKQFYQRYYTPARAMLVIVGNVDIDALTTKVENSFGDWRPQKGEAAIVDYGSVALDRPGASGAFIDPAIGEAAAIVAFGSNREIPDTLQTRREALLRSIGYRIITRRIGRAIRSGDAPFLSASFDSTEVFDRAYKTQLTVSARDGQLPEAVAAAEKIIRQALQYGFTQQETEEQVANYRNAIRNAVKGAETRRNETLAEQIVDATYYKRLVTSPEARQARFERVAQDITPELVLEALKSDLIDLADPLIHITAKSGGNAYAEDVRSAYLASRQLAVAPPEQGANQQFAYTYFGREGEIVSDSIIEDLGIRTVRFSNNVRLNIKPTQYEKDRVRISLRIDGGELVNTIDNPHGTALLRVFSNGGLEAHSLDDLLTILAGKSVSFNFDAGADYFGSYVTTTTENTLLQFQILAAYLTAPGYRDSAVERYRKGFDNYYARIEATPDAALGTHIGEIISDGDPRFTLAPQDELEALDFNDLRQIVSEPFTRAPLEIGVVGDIDPDVIIADVAKTFGALPARESNSREYADQRQRSFTANRSTRYIAHDGEPHQAILRYYWPTADDSDFASTIRSSLLAKVLQLRLTDILREELGSSYSPSASSFMSSVYDDFGYLTFGSAVDFNDRAKVRETMRDIVAEIIASPATEDELLRARKPILERLKQRETSNSSWIAIVDEAQTDKEALQRYRILPEVIAQVTVDDLQQEARKWLSQEPLVVEVIHRQEYARIIGTSPAATDAD